MDEEEELEDAELFEEPEAPVIVDPGVPVAAVLLVPVEAAVELQ